MDLYVKRRVESPPDESGSLLSSIDDINAAGSTPMCRAFLVRFRSGVINESTHTPYINSTHANDELYDWHEKWRTNLNALVYDAASPLHNKSLFFYFV